VQSGHDRVQVGGKVARGAVMSEAVVAEPDKHPGAIGVDIGAGRDDVAGELHLIHTVGRVGQLQHAPPRRPLVSRSTVMVIGAFSAAAPRLAVAADVLNSVRGANRPQTSTTPP
jgi:hypothetical protein